MNHLINVDEIAKQVLYEDNHIIILNKKPSQVIQSANVNDMEFGEMVKQYLKVKYDKPGDAYLAMVHRLDRPVSGIIMYAKTGKAGKRIAKIFFNREIKKIYWAIVKKKPEPENGILIHYLRKNEKQNKSYAFDHEVEGSFRSELSYRYLTSSDNYHLLEVELMTGRHHQIRAQLSTLGCFIKGDLKYGYDRPNHDLSICLHARYLVFVHPVTHEEIRVIAPPPPDPLWDFFTKKMEDIQKKNA